MHARRTPTQPMARADPAGTLLLLAAFVRTASAQANVPPPPSPAPPGYGNYDDYSMHRWTYLSMVFPMLFVTSFVCLISMRRRQRMLAITRLQYAGTRQAHNGGCNGIAMTNMANVNQPRVVYGQTACMNTAQAGSMYGVSAMPPQAGSMYGVSAVPPQAGSMYGVIAMPQAGSMYGVSTTAPQGGIVQGTSVGAIPNASTPVVVAMGVPVSTPVDARNVVVARTVS